MIINILKRINKSMERLCRNGSTTTMMEFYKTLPDFNLVTHNTRYGLELMRNNKIEQRKIQILSVDDPIGPFRFHGNHNPIAVDNGAFMHVIQLGIDGINEAERKTEYLENRISTLKMCLDMIGSVLKDFWPFHYDERKWGHHYNERDEYLRIVRLTTHALRSHRIPFRNRNIKINAIKYNRVKYNQTGRFKTGTGFRSRRLR